jgi:chromosome partitioning protein
MAYIFSLVNHKGGVGKTTTTLNLGKGLSLEGKRVLLVDMDPQANLSQSVGIDNPEMSVYEVLCQNADPDIQNISKNLDILPAELSLSTAETQLMSEQVSGYFKLNNALKQITDNYDFILIDCPPSLGILTINALLASHSIMIIVEPQYLAIKGLQTIIELYTRLNQNLGKDLKLLGMLFTQFNRTVISKNIMEQVQERYGELAFETVIRQSVKITEASALKQDVFTYEPNSAPAEDYLNLAKELLKRI